MGFKNVLNFFGKSFLDRVDGGVMDALVVDLGPYKAYTACWAGVNGYRAYVKPAV